MSIVTWGKPTIEIGKSIDGAQSTTFNVVENPIEDSLSLDTTQGDEVEVKVEGGDTLDSKRKSNTYEVKFTVPVVKGYEEIIPHEDGVVKDKYSFRLTPEDETLPGFVMDHCSVSVSETYTTADGERREITMKALKPKTGAMKKPYIKEAEPEPEV